jgi:hypothetical protein
MIYLYVKKAPTGLFYLGKTIQNPYKYKGSGSHWKKHLKFHNINPDEIQTWILHETENKDEVYHLGIYYSNLFNVVKSSKWANEKEEIGDGGFGSKESHPWYGRKKTKEHNEIISQKLKGNKNNLGNSHKQESIEKMRLAQKGVKKKTSKCPYCEKEGNENVMRRWHFDKCPIKTGIKREMPKQLREVLDKGQHPFKGKKRPEHSEFMKKNNPNSKK